MIFSKALELKLSTGKECGRGALAVKAGLLVFWVFFLRATSWCRSGFLPAVS